MRTGPGLPHPAQPCNPIHFRTHCTVHDLLCSIVHSLPTCCVYFCWMKAMRSSAELERSEQNLTTWAKR